MFCSIVCVVSAQAQQNQSMSKSAQDIVDDARDDEIYVSALAQQHYNAAARPLRDDLQSLAGARGRGARLRRIAQLLALAVPTGTAVSVGGLSYSIRAYEYGPYRYRVLQEGVQPVGDLGTGIASLSRLHRFNEHCDAVVDAFTSEAVKQADPELRRPALALLALLGQKPPKGANAPSGADCVANIVMQALDDLEQQSRDDDPYSGPGASTLQTAAFLAVIEKGWCGTSEIDNSCRQGRIQLERFEQGGDAGRSPFGLPYLGRELGQIRERFLQYGSAPVHLPAKAPSEKAIPSLEEKVALLERVYGMGEQNRWLAQTALAKLGNQLYGCDQLPLRQHTPQGDLVIELKGTELYVRLGKAVICGSATGWREHHACTTEFAACLELLQDAAVGASLKVREQSLTQKAAGLSSGTLSLPG